MRGYLLLMSIAMLIACASAQSAPSNIDQRPQVEADKKAERGAQPKKVASATQSEPRNTPPAVPVVIPSVQASPAEPKREHGSDEGSEFWPPVFGYRVKVTDSLLVLFTFLLWLATRALVNDARDTSHRHLRAYLGATDANIVNFGVGQKIEVVVAIKNTGQTPAYNVHIQSVLAILPYPNKMMSKAGAAPPKTTMVIGGGKGIHHRASLERSFTEKEVSDIKSGAFALYLMGTATYLDVFTKSRRYSNFRLSYRDEVGSNPNHSMYIDDTGNEADYSD